jgi:primosomal protein N' (replication factor Y)
MDRDTASGRRLQERLLRQWEKGEIEILVGTQMITKGHDVAGVTLVGVLLADLSLNMPDFRAAERTFQILSQVAGRAGRGKEPGSVIVQTYTPDHYALQCVSGHDYLSFFESEMEFRRALNYPPCGRLVLLRIEGPRLQDVERSAKLLGDWLRAEQKRDDKLQGIEILGPASAPIEKLRSRYRWQILSKGKLQSKLLDFVSRARQHFQEEHGVRLRIDVDPHNML